MKKTSSTLTDKQEIPNISDFFYNKSIFVSVKKKMEQQETSPKQESFLNKTIFKEVKIEQDSSRMEVNLPPKKEIDK
jgi:hypothetical protein